MKKQTFTLALIALLTIAVIAAIPDHQNSQNITTRRNQGKIIKHAIQSVEQDTVSRYSGTWPAAGTIDTLVNSDIGASDYYWMQFTADPGTTATTWITTVAGTAFVTSRVAFPNAATFDLFKRPAH